MRWRAREAGGAIALPATPCPRAAGSRGSRAGRRPGPAGTRSALDAWATGPYQRPPPTRPRYAQHGRALPLATGRVATTARIRRSPYGPDGPMLCPSLRAGLARSGGYPINRPVEGQMPVRSMSDPEPARLSGWSAEAAVEDAVTYVTALLRRSVVTGGFNRQQNRLGVMIQLSTSPWLGWIPDDPAVARRLHDRLAHTSRRPKSTNT